MLSAIKNIAKTVLIVLLCPDLNPIERVWKLARKCCTHNEYFPTLDSIAHAVEHKFDEWAPGSEVHRKFCAIN